MYIHTEVRGNHGRRDEFDTHEASDGFAKVGDYIIMSFSAEIEAANALKTEGAIEVPVFKKTFRQGLPGPEERTVVGPFPRVVGKNRFQCDTQAAQVMALIRERSKLYVENPVSTNSRRMPTFRIVK